jgi:lipopolysaccharide export system permease protein
MTQSYEDQAIILADSGMLQSTEEKKHLVLNLWSGEWFENMESSEFGNTAAIPYRRETFAKKRIILDFDGDFSLTDAADLSNNSKGKSLAELRRDVDSMSIRYDSIGKVFMADARMSYYRKDLISKKDSLKALTTEKAQTLNFDSLYNKLSDAQKLAAVNGALNKVQAEVTDLEFKKMVTSDGDWLIRRHRIEEYSKFTLALSCLIFFFIGAPLGAIIRKGGLGIPIIVSVLVFIFYFILDNTGYRMSREGIWAVWFGKGLSSAVLIPIAIFVTYKANNDSMVFNLDLWKDLFMRMLGLRIKRHVYGKEVVIQEPGYAEDAERLAVISKNVVNYSRVHNLKSAPNAIKLFFKYEPDHEIERISEELEAVIEDLSNTRDNRILTELNNYPILAVKAHTRPFERSWMNVVAGIFLPTGIFFYFRMWGFRLRLFKDLRVIRQTNANIISRTKALI